MALMRFDPFRELDRLAEQALAGARTASTVPMEALRRGDPASFHCRAERTDLAAWPSG